MTDLANTKMPFEYLDVIEGDTRIRCYSSGELDTWMTYMIEAGRVPHLEAGPIKKEVA